MKGEGEQNLEKRTENLAFENSGFLFKGNLTLKKSKVREEGRGGGGNGEGEEVWECIKDKGNENAVKVFDVKISNFSQLSSIITTNLIKFSELG